MISSGGGFALCHRRAKHRSIVRVPAFRLRFESQRVWLLRLLLCNWFAGCQAVETRGAALLICGRGERRRVAGERSRRPRWRGERLRGGLYVAWRCLRSLSSLASGRYSAAECNWRQYGSHERHHGRPYTYTRFAEVVGGERSELGRSLNRSFTDQALARVPVARLIVAVKFQTAALPDRISRRAEASL